MRPKLTERKGIIRDFTHQYYREDEDDTGIPPASVHRFLVEMREDGEISYDDRRSAGTADLDHVSPKNLMPVLGHVACGPGQEEEEQPIGYIHMPEEKLRIRGLVSQPGAENLRSKDHSFSQSSYSAASSFPSITS